MYQFSDKLLDDPTPPRINSFQAQPAELHEPALQDADPEFGAVQWYVQHRVAVLILFT